MNTIQLSNIAFLALVALILLVFCERMISTFMALQVRRNLSAADAGLPAPFTMKDWRSSYRQRRATRAAAGIALAALLITTAYHTAQGQPVSIEQGQARNIKQRNILLARAEKMARAGNKGLMRANIAHARKCGPVDALMVARIEDLLAR